MSNRFVLVALLCSGLLLGGCSSSAKQPLQPAQGDAGQSSASSALADLRRQARQGDLDSQFQLGSRYFVSQPKDLKQAEYWWQQAADKGHAMAAVSLAYLYTGRDNPQFHNPQQMLKYLNQSAAGGNPMAQHILGNLYLSGEQGVARDPLQARALFHSACRQN